MRMMLNNVKFGYKTLIRGNNRELSALERLAAKLDNKTQRITDPQSGGEYLGIYSNDDARHFDEYTADVETFTRASCQANATAVVNDDVKLPQIRFQDQFDPNFLDFNNSQPAGDLFEAFRQVFS